MFLGAPQFLSVGVDVQETNMPKLIDHRGGNAVCGTRDETPRMPGVGFPGNNFRENNKARHAPGQSSHHEGLINWESTDITSLLPGHGTPLKWMFTAVQEHGNLCDCDTDVMAADICTKHFYKRNKVGECV